MTIHTASEGVSLARKLENDSARFYESVAQCYPGDAETFLSFARENKKNIAQFERAYYGVISDAIEGCFAFNMNPDDYTFDTAISGDTSYADILNQALKIEDKLVKFYSDAAEQSKCLMADVPVAFRMIARKREARRPKLMALLDRQS